MLFTQKSEVDIHEMSPLALAFVGDGGFLFVYSPLTYCAMATGLFLAASLVWAGLFYVGVRRRFEHG